MTTAYIQVTDQKGRTPLAPAVRLNVPEHKDIEFHGLDPGTPVGIRLLGDEHYLHVATTDSQGRLLPDKDRRGHGHVLQRFCIDQRGGETFEVRCMIEGEEIDFFLRLELYRFSKEKVEAMLDDLRSMGLRWDARSPIPTRAGDLEERTRDFIELSREMAKAFNGVLADPDEILRQEERSIPARQVKRISVRSIHTNLRTKRIAPTGRILANDLLVPVDVPTQDTAGNTYAAECIRVAERSRTYLLKQVALEERRLIKVKRREENYYEEGESPTIEAVRRLLERLAALREELKQAALPPVPDSWKRFTSTPDASENIVRFDPRYQTLKRARDAVTARSGAAAAHDRLQRIAEFGRRAHNDIYEIWTVAKTVETLYQLGFRRTSENGVREAVEAFLELESPLGGEYGLRSGAEVALQHKDADHLYLKIGYEPRIRVREDPNGKTRTPDIALVLRNGPDTKRPPRYGDQAYGGNFLFLDAKFREMHPGDETFEAIEKYVELLPGSHAHLIQAEGAKPTWTQRTQEEDLSAARRLGLLGNAENVAAYYPYRVGKLSLAPTKESEALHGNLWLKRVIHGWLVMQHLIAICPRCGGALERAGKADRDPESGLCRYAFRAFRLGRNRQPPRSRNLVCHHCDLGVTANWCGSCWKSEKVFVPILKLYPSATAQQENDGPTSAEWIEDYEIAAQGEKYQFRHCPRCGRDR